MERTEVTIHVDPSCPFAWITSRWLAEVEQAGRAQATYAIVSLSVVNDGRELDAWYREFNDKAWGPARVAAAVLDRHGEAGLRRFYEAFGTLHHVDERQDALTEALARAGLEADLAEAATDSEWDDTLRRYTTAALAPVGADVGTPILHIGDAGFFGPILSSIPRGEDAVAIFDATVTLAGFAQFHEYKRGRPQDLQTS